MLFSTFTYEEESAVSSQDKKSKKRKHVISETNSNKKVKRDENFLKVRRKSLRNRDKIICFNQETECTAKTEKRMKTCVKEIKDEIYKKVSRLKKEDSSVQMDESQDKYGAMQDECNTATDVIQSCKNEDSTEVSVRRSSRTKKKVVNYSEIEPSAKSSYNEKSVATLPKQEESNELKKVSKTSPANDFSVAVELNTIEKQEAMKTTLQALELLQRSPRKTRPVIGE